MSVTIEITVSGLGPDQRYTITIPQRQARDFFEPLPPGYDSPLNQWARDRTRGILRRRAHAMSLLTGRVRDIVEQMLRSRDPVRL